MALRMGVVEHVFVYCFYKNGLLLSGLSRWVTSDLRIKMVNKKRRQLDMPFY